MKRRKFLKSLGIVTAGVALASCVKREALEVEEFEKYRHQYESPIEWDVPGNVEGAITTVSHPDGEILWFDVPSRAVFELPVTGQDEQGNRRIVVGDPLCFHQDTGRIDGSRGMVIGYANGVVEPGETKVINVLIDESPAYWTTQIYGDVGWTRA